jgi:Uma2 family endonuclease
MAVPHATRLRADDLWETPDDGNRYEIIAGALAMSPPPRWGHQRGISKLHLAVGNHVYANDLREVVESPVGVILGPTTAVQPDMVFVSESRRHIISERGVEGAPDLVVEIFS